MTNENDWKSIIFSAGRETRTICVLRKYWFARLTSRRRRSRTYSCLINGLEWLSSSIPSSSSSSTTSLVRWRTKLFVANGNDDVEEEVHGLNGNDEEESVMLDFSLADAERLKNRLFESFFDGNSSRIKAGWVTQQTDEGNEIFELELCRWSRSEREYIHELSDWTAGLGMVVVLWQCRCRDEDLRSM